MFRKKKQKISILIFRKILKFPLGSMGYSPGLRNREADSVRRWGLIRWFPGISDRRQVPQNDHHRVKLTVSYLTVSEILSSIARTLEMHFSTTV